MIRFGGVVFQTGPATRRTAGMQSFLHLVGNSAFHGGWYFPFRVTRHLTVAACQTCPVQPAASFGLAIAGAV